MLIGMINTIGEYLIVGFMTIILLSVLYFIGYYFIYKKIFRGNKYIDLKRAFTIKIFVAYILVVLFATLFGRFSDTLGSINLELFSSYKRAISTSSVFLWRDITLNILMFIPLGLLLPLVNKVFYKPYFTILLSFCFTLSIEISQLITKIGAFDVDDIFNNFLGAIIGYCLVMTILSATSENKHKIRKTICYILPIIIVIIAFIGLFIC